MSDTAKTVRMILNKGNAAKTDRSAVRRSNAALMVAASSLAISLYLWIGPTLGY